MEILLNQKYGNHPRDTFDFYPVISDKPNPLLIYIHGGGFTEGDKADIYIEDKNGANQNSIAYASINYPLSPEMPLKEILKHIGRAVQYFAYNADKYNIDKNRIACCGCSAGAGASLFLATTTDMTNPLSIDPVERESTKVCAIGLYETQATYNFFNWVDLFSDKIPNIDALFSQSAPLVSQMYDVEVNSYSDKDKYKEIAEYFDMLGNINKDTPPVFIKCDCKEDDLENFLHHPIHSRAIYHKCKEHNVICDYQSGNNKWFYEFLLNI